MTESRFYTVPMPASLASTYWVGACLLAGGHILRAVLGQPSGKDIDIFFFNRASLEAQLDQLTKDGWVAAHGDQPASPGGGQRLVLSHPNEPWNLDLIYNTAWHTIADTMAGFDLSVSRVFFDGLACHAEPGVWADIDARVMRYTGKQNARTPPRVKRYAGLGLKLVR